MSWEQRGNRWYSYRSLRVDGQPRKVYLGSGMLGEVHERLLAEERRRREAGRQARRVELARLAAAGATLDGLWAVAELIARATLLVGGYHEHRGQWRRRHGTDTQSGRAGQAGL